MSFDDFGVVHLWRPLWSAKRAHVYANQRMFKTVSTIKCNCTHATFTKCPLYCVHALFEFTCTRRNNTVDVYVDALAGGLLIRLHLCGTVSLFKK